MKKRLEMFALPATMPNTMPVAQEALTKHDYRNIKIDENTTITIDLEEIKKEIKESFFSNFLSPLA